MLFNTLENKSKQNEKKLRELTLQYERLNKDIEQFFTDLDVKPEQLSQMASNPDNFTPKAWEELKRLHKELEERLEKDLSSIRDIGKAKKSFEEKNVSRHWIYCR